MKKSTLSLLLLAGIAAQPAMAGDWFVRGGATLVDPKSDNGELAGYDASIGSNTQLGLTFGYHISPSVAFEVLAATPFSHEVSLDGLGEVAEFKHLPPTFSVQYYFNAEGTVSPFIGAGLNYTWTFDEETKGALDGNDISIDNSFGLAGQLGLRFALANDWDIVADARYIDISADVKLNGTDIGTADVNPMVYSIMLGKRF
ncbi:MAG TPA: OmpW family outer membrane protein [Arenimonas sp.]|nr:OmpW family outer membrane protein [Arenimonas sp.]